MSETFHFDFQRVKRIGLSEAVLCAGKSPPQIDAIVAAIVEKQHAALLTRLSENLFAELSAETRAALDFDPESGTAFLGKAAPLRDDFQVAVVTAGSSDSGVAAEARRTLRFHGCDATAFADIGVAGLWRLNKYLDQLATFPVVIVVAGMDGALPSVVGGLLGGVVIALPTSTGYGVAEGGRTALNAALTSCAPGVVVVNIDNGYGAAIAALRALGIGRQE